MNFYARFTGSFLKGADVEFGAVVNPYPGCFSPPGYQLLQLANYPVAAHGTVHGDAKTFPVVIVDDMERLETNAVVQGIVNEMLQMMLGVIGHKRTT
jgi:hypothetical protein